VVKFALACEGITDQIVLENILCGFYKDYDDLDEEIQAFQPPYDTTQQKQKDDEFGGWEMLLSYLSEKRFRENVLNSEYMIIQIDTDISEHPNFGVSQKDLSTKELIKKVIEELITRIDSKKPFYQNNKAKIFFAISVHSLECWILPLFYDSDKKGKITGCADALNREASKKIKRLNFDKNHSVYNKLSNQFNKNKILLEIASKNSSFQIFISSLPSKI